MSIIYNGISTDIYHFFLESDTIGLMPVPRDRVIKADEFDGSLFQGKDFSPREFELSGVISPNSIEELETCIESFVKLFSFDEDRPLVLDKYPGIELRCRLNGNISRLNTGSHCRLTIPLIAQDPFWYSIEEYSIDILGSGSLESFGNYPTSRLKIIVSGIATDPQIEIRGQLVTYTGTLSAVDKLIIDSSKRIITFNTANASRNHNKMFPKIYPGLNNLSISSGSMTVKWHDCWL
jgi:phage-related protein